MTDYQKMSEFFLEIESLHLKVSEQGFYFRDMQRVVPKVPLPVDVRPMVDLDRIYCALATRAVTTHRAIFTLCEAGDGDSAFTLTRVLWENAVLMKWLLGEPQRDRLETYVLFTNALQTRFVATASAAYSQYPELVEKLSHASNPYDATIAEAVFQGNDDTFAYLPDPKAKNGLKRSGPSTVAHARGHRSTCALWPPY